MTNFTELMEALPDDRANAWSWLLEGEQESAWLILTTSSFAEVARLKNFLRLNERRERDFDRILREHAPVDPDAANQPANGLAWEVRESYDWEHGLYRNTADGPVKVLDECIIPEGLLVVNSVVEALQVKVSTSVEGRERKVVISSSVISSRNPSTEIEAECGETWTPEEAKEVQKYLAWLKRNTPEELRIQAFKRPGWKDDHLLIPGIPNGVKWIGDSRLTEYGKAGWTAEKDEAKDLVKSLYEEAIHFEKFGVMLGGSTCSVFLKQMGLHAHGFLIHNVGMSTKGKTESAKSAISVYGDPDEIMKDWNATAVGLSELVSLHGVLPVLLDETGTANKKIANDQIIQLIFQVGTGRGRARSTQTGGLAKASEPTNLVVLSTGERRLTSAGTEGGIRARVIEQEAPIFPTKEDSQRVAGIARQLHGYIINVIADGAYGWLTEYKSIFETLLPQLESSITDTIAVRLCTAITHCMTGLALVGMIGGLDKDTVIKQVLEIGKKVAAESAATIYSDGEDQSIKFYNAVMEWAFRYNGNFAQEVSQLFQKKDADPDNKSVNDREVMGLIKDGMIAIVPAILDRIAKEANIDDYQVLLKPLAEQGKLILSSDGRLQKSYSTRIGKKVVSSRLYVFNMEDGAE